MKRALAFVAYATVLTFGLYIFEMHHDWRPDKVMVPTARAFFAGLELSSVVALTYSRRRWLPGALLGTALVAAPLISGAGFTLAYAVWGSILFACAFALGAVIRLRGTGG
jgi:hypothetical protein